MFSVAQNRNFTMGKLGDPQFQAGGGRSSRLVWVDRIGRARQNAPRFSIDSGLHLRYSSDE